jgi:DNA invertase Pin-like site-specific DNA recombinase
MKAVTYARFSSDKQRDASVEDQARNCRIYAEQQHWQIVRHFEDKAVSGMSKDRPGFKAMLAAAAAGEFDILLVDDLSRLSRDDVETKQVIRRFKFKGLRIIACSDGYDSAAKGEKIQSSMRGLMNELYLDDLREKTHRGLYGQALAGNHTGGRCYGYRQVAVEDPLRKDPHGRPVIIAVRREVEEAQAVIVREIFRRYADGESPRAIAAALNGRGVPSPGASWNREAGRTEALWMGSAIAGDHKRGIGILNNEIYVGRLVWNRLRWEKDPETGRRCWRVRPESEWVTQPMPDLRIVSDELWGRVKERQKARSALIGERIRAGMLRSNAKSIGGGPKYLFSGLLKCGCCGANFIICNHDKYGCASRAIRGKDTCSNRLLVSKAIVESRLLEGLKKRLLSNDLPKEIGRRIRLIEQHRSEKRLEPDPAQIEKLREEIRNLTEAIAGGLLRSSPALAERLRAAEVGLARLMAIRAVSNDERVVRLRPNLAAYCQAVVANLEKLVPVHTGRARDQIRRFIGEERITLRPAPSGDYLRASGGIVLKDMAARGGHVNDCGCGEAIWQSFTWVIDLR